MRVQKSLASRPPSSWSCTTFSADVQRGGIDGLIRALAEKNGALAAKKASGQS